MFDMAVVKFSLYIINLCIAVSHKAIWKFLYIFFRIDFNVFQLLGIVLATFGGVIYNKLNYYTNFIRKYAYIGI